MRFAITPAQLKKLASRMGTHMPHVSHNQMLNVLARGFGWRDWHEVSSMPEERLSGAKFPIAVNEPLRDTGDLGNVEYMAYRQQMHVAFAEAFGETCPGVADDTELFSMLDLAGCTDNPVRVVKQVREGLPSVAVKSGFYRLSLTDMLGLNPDPDDVGKYLNLADEIGVRDCQGYELDPGESPVALDPSELMPRATYHRWFDAVAKHSFEQPVFSPGLSKEPIFMVCEALATREQLGSVVARWEVVCPANVPHYTGTLELIAVASTDSDVTWSMAASLPMMVDSAIDAAVWGLAGSTEAQLTVRVVNAFGSRDAMRIAHIVYELLSDKEALAPCLSACRARLELVERKSDSEKVVRSTPEVGKEFAKLGPPVHVRTRRAMVARSMFSTGERILNANNGEGEHEGRDDER